MQRTRKRKRTDKHINYIKERQITSNRKRKIHIKRTIHKTRKRKIQRTGKRTYIHRERYT